MWVKTAALYGEFAKICAVSFVFLDKTGTKLLCKELKGTDEVKLLEEVGAFLDKINKGGKEYRLAAHAGKYFDYSFLGKRFVINGLDLPTLIDTSHLKPWEIKNIDTNMDVWKFGGTGPGSSLQALCTALQLPVSKVDLVGDEVGAAYFRGEINRIGRYCSYDAIATFNIIRRIKKEPIFQFDEVTFLDQQDKEVIEEASLIERIYAARELTEELQKELYELIEDKELTEEDKVNLGEILKAILIRTDFVNQDQDTKAVKEFKEEQVNDFIENIQ